MEFVTDWLAPLVARGLRAHVRLSDTEDELHRPRVRVQEDISNLQISADTVGFVQILEWHGTGRHLSATVVDNCTQLRAIFSAYAVAAWTKENPGAPLSAIRPGTVLKLYCAEIRISDCFDPPRVELYITHFEIVGPNRQATPPRAPPVEIYAIPYVTQVLNTFSQQRRDNDMAARMSSDSSPALASQAEASGSEEEESSFSQSKFLTQVPNPPSKRPTKRLLVKVQSPTMPHTRNSGIRDDLLGLVPNKGNVARRDKWSVGGLKENPGESLMNKENQAMASEPTPGQAAQEPDPQNRKVHESPAKALPQAIGPVGVQQLSRQSEQTSPQSAGRGGCNADPSNKQGRNTADSEQCNQQQTEEEGPTQDPWTKWRGSLVSGRPCIPRTAHIIPRQQLKLLATDGRWQPPLIGQPMIPGNVPLDLLNRLTAAVDEEASAPERPSSQQEPRAAQTHAERLEDGAGVSIEAGAKSQQNATLGSAAVSHEGDSEADEEPEIVANAEEWPQTSSSSPTELSPPRREQLLPPDSSLPDSAEEYHLQVSRTPAFPTTSSAPGAPEASRQRPTSSSPRIPATVGPGVRHVRQAQSPAHSPVDLPQFEVSDDEESAKREVRVPVSTLSPEQQVRASQQLWGAMDQNALQSDEGSVQRHVEPNGASDAAQSTTSQKVQAETSSGVSFDGSAMDTQDYNVQRLDKVDDDQQGQAEVNQKPNHQLPAKRSLAALQDLSPNRKRVKLDSSISDESSTSEDSDFQNHKAETRAIRRQFFATCRTDHERLPSSQEELSQPQNTTKSTAPLAPTSQNVDTRSPSPRSSSVRSYRQRDSGLSLIRQITTSTPITSVSHHHVMGKAHSSLLRAASYGSSAQSHRMEDGFSIYKSAYPEYTGSLSQFAKSCLLVRRLCDEGRPLPQGVLDDFIYRHHHDYRGYIADVIGSAELESPMPYEKYYMDCVEEPTHCKRVIKKVFIDALPSSDSVGKLARDTMYGQQSRPASHEPQHSLKLFVLPQTMTRRSQPRSIAASDSASNVLKLTPPLPGKLEEAETTIAASNSLQDQLYHKEQEDSKKQSQESSVEEWLERAGGGSPELGTPVDLVSSQVPTLDLTEESEPESELVRALHQPRPVCRPLQKHRRPPTRSAQKTVFQSFLEANSLLGAERRIWTSIEDDCEKKVRPEVQRIINIFSWRR